MTSQDANSLWVRVYTVDGFECSLTLPVNSAADAARVIDDVRAAGFLARKPDAPTGDVEQIAAVIRRQPKQGTTQIDFYPAWSHNNKFGKHKFASLYLDTPDDVAQFEAQSGLKLANLPIYKSKSPIEREPGEVNEFEVTVARSFEMRRAANGQHEGGMPKYEYSYAKPLTLMPQATNAAQSNAVWTKQEAADFYRHWISEGMTQPAIFEALGVKQLGDWKQSAKAAHDAVQGYIEHFTGANQS